MIETIRQIGILREPEEACGVILPFGGLLELTNTHMSPRVAFMIDQEELAESVKDWLRDLPRQPPAEVEIGLVVWHTHPSGHVGPSEGDMEIRRSYIDRGYNIPQLVVALPSGLATRF